MQTLKPAGRFHRWSRTVCKTVLRSGFAFFPRNVAVRRHGVRYLLDLRDDVQQLVFLHLYEADDLKRLRHFIGPGSICFDAGAHVGVFSILMAHLAGTHGHVFSFEPDPDNVRRLACNIAMNGLASAVTVEEAALGAAPGVLGFHKSEEGHSAWGSVIHYEDLKTRRLTVRVESLDEYCRCKGIERVDLLKIDVEGFEFELLYGAARLFEQRKVKAVLVEFNGPRQTQQRHTLEEMIGFFRGCGYELLYEREKLAELAADRRRSEAMLKNLWFGLPSEARQLQAIRPS